MGDIAYRYDYMEHQLMHMISWRPSDIQSSQMLASRPRIWRWFCRNCL